MQLARKEGNNGMSQHNRWDPEHYAKHSATQLGHAKDLIEGYPFRGDERILDIGCGDGKITAALSHYIPNGHITGIDKSHEMIDFAKQAFLPDYKNAEFKVQDVLDLNEMDKYDLIVSFSCLHYVKYQEAALQNICRALKPKGKLLFMLYRKCPAQWSAIDKVISSAHWRNYFDYFDPGYYEYVPETYQKLLDRSVLRQFTARFTPVEYITFESKDKLNKFMRGWLPHLQKVPKEQHDLFMQKIVDAYVDELGLKENQDIRIPFVRLLIS